jgi:Type VI secretion system effector, Hcp
MKRLRGRLTYANVMSTVAAFLALGGAVAFAAVPGNEGVINACYEVQQNGTTPLAGAPNVRIIDPSAGQTCNPAGGAGPTEHALSWNVSGPPGPEGAAGSPGAQGATGPQGASGPAGSTVSIGGQTFTLGDGKTLSAPASLIPPLQAAPGGPPVATMSFGSGGGATSSDVLAWQLVGGAGAGARGIQIVKRVDKSSPILQIACVSGKHFPRAVLHVRSTPAAGGPQTIILTNARVDSYATDKGKGKGGKETATETVSLSYGSIKVEYQSQ